MEYDKLLPSRSLEALTHLQKRVQDFADLCEPDHLCELPSLHDEIRFVSLDLDEEPTGLSGEEISLQINGKNHLFTEWSRHQLLDHLGTREKWFSRVTLHDQARELTRRVHTFDRHRFRTMRTYEQINYVRGLVSQGYVDIPDVDIMQALCTASPEGECLATYSGKSDKAFYVYMLTRHAPIGIGKNMVGFPGAIVKNSEVGSTALLIVPFFLLVHEGGGFMAPVALRRQAILRKIHRGRFTDLHESLGAAINDLEAVWGPMTAKVNKLMTRRFPDDAAAIARMETLLLAMKMSKRFVAKCATTYRAANNTAHNGLTLLTAVLAACATGQLDSRYDDAEVAGYLLLQLL